MIAATVLPSVHTYWVDTVSEALRVLRTHGIMTLSVLKKETFFLSPTIKSCLLSDLTTVRGGFA